MENYIEIFLPHHIFDQCSYISNRSRTETDFSFVNTGEDNVLKTSFYTSKMEMHSGYFLISFIDLTWIWLRSAMSKGHYITSGNSGKSYLSYFLLLCNLIVISLLFWTYAARHQDPRLQEQMWNKYCCIYYYFLFPFIIL